MLVAGREIIIKNNRFLNCTPNALRVADLTDITTRGVTIEDLFMSGVDQVTLDPVVAVDETCENVRIWQSATQFTTLPATLNDLPVRKTSQLIRKGANQSVDTSTTLVNDTQLFFPMLAKQRIEFRLEFWIERFGHGSACRQRAAQEAAESFIFW